MSDVDVPTALLPDSVSALRDAIEEALTSSEPIVLRGGNPFCAGLGLDALREPEADRVEATRTFAEVLIKLKLAPVAVIAAVDRPAAGGGVGLLAAADWVVASPDAVFALPELPHGLLPATILPLLQERLRPQQVRRLAMQAAPIDASEALRIGLVDQVADDDEFEAAVRASARTLGRAKPRSIAALKQALSGDIAAEIRRGAEQTAQDICNPEIIGPIVDFLDGGPPPWSRE